MQPAAPRDEVVARPQVEVIRVAEDDRRADVLEIARRHRLDRALRADRHEDRRLDRSVRGGQDAATSEPSRWVTWKEHMVVGLGRGLT